MTLHDRCRLLREIENRVAVETVEKKRVNVDNIPRLHLVLLDILAQSIDNNSITLVLPDDIICGVTRKKFTGDRNRRGYLKSGSAPHKKREFLRRIACAGCNIFHD